MEKGTNFKPCKNIKFLGATIQANGKFNMTLDEKCTKIRTFAWLIRSKWILNKKQHVSVYRALVHGQIFNNAEICLPRLPKILKSKLQVAVNACLRANDIKKEFDMEVESNMINVSSVLIKSEQILDASGNVKTVREHKREWFQKIFAYKQNMDTDILTKNQKTVPVHEWDGSEM